MPKIKRYTQADGAKRWLLSRRGTYGLTIAALLLIATGVYLLFMLQSPNIQPLNEQQQANFLPNEIAASQVIIPKIAVNTPILEGDATVLDKGVWHRLPNLGDPLKGGNFILTAHRYVLSRTPGQTKDKSFFYNLDKLNEGDIVYVDWQHTRYTYVIKSIYAVKPTALEVESPSKEPKLTIYTCTLGGSADGRVVIEARLKQ